MKFNIDGFASFIRYLFRCKKELILLAAFYIGYFHFCCKGRYLPLPVIGQFGIFPYFTFGLRNKGTKVRSNTYSFYKSANPWEDPTKMDILKPAVEELQFQDSNFTYAIPSRYPALDSWSESMRTFIAYNLDENPELTGNNKKIFKYAVDTIDEIAEHSSNAIRRLCHKYERAVIKNRVAADALAFGFFRMDSAFELPNNHNSTRLVCKMVWDIKEIVLMSKYHLYMPNNMLKDHLKDIRQIMEFLDNAQDLPKYYDSPDWNLNGRLGQDFLRFEQFINEDLPILDDVKLSNQGPWWWWPMANQKNAFADGRLLKLRSSRNAINGSAMLHPGAENFYGFNRGRSYIERFQVIEEEDVNDQNRFNYGHLPEPMAQRHAYETSKPHWTNGYCPWGSDNQRVLTADTLAELRVFENLAIESVSSGESQKCEPLDVNFDTAIMSPTVHFYYGYAEKFACQPVTMLGPVSPGYYMDIMRANFPYNDDCYRRQNMVAIVEVFGIVRSAAWAYHKRWNWSPPDRQLFLEAWFWLIILPALLCGNHRGKVEHRLNKIHD